MTYLQSAFWIIGACLQLLVLKALKQGPIDRFPVIFAYAICLVITTLTDILAYVYLGVRHPRYAYYYWSAELLRQSTLFAVVLSLVLDALQPGRRRVLLVRTLVGGAAVLWVASLLYHRNPNLNLWMTRAVRDLSFTSAVTTLILWFTLISTDKRDTLRLLVTGALGLQVTGEAIGQAIRQLYKSPAFAVTGNIVVVLTHFLCLYIWIQAFSKHARKPEPTLANVPARL